MKPKKMIRKLTLNKSTIASLNSKKLGAVKGGYWYTALYGPPACYTWHPECVTQPEYQCNETEVPVDTID